MPNQQIFSLNPLTFANPLSKTVIGGGMSAVAGPVNGHTFKTFINDTYIEGAFLGSQIEFNLFSTTVANPYEISIDGGAPIPITGLAANSVWTYVGPTGLVDDNVTIHTFKLRFLNAAGTNAIDIDASFRVTSNFTPQMFTPSRFVGTNIYYPITHKGFMREGDSFLTWGGSGLGIASPANGIIAATPSGAVTADSGLRFLGTLSFIRIWALCNGAVVKVRVDDTEPYPSVTLPNTGRFDWVDIATGLDKTADHDYTIYAVAPSAAFFGLLFYQVCVDGYIKGTPPPPRPLLLVWGDSNAAGFVASNDSSQGYAHLLALALGYGIAPKAVYGSTLTTNGGAASSGVNRETDVTGISQAPLVILHAYGGTNDQNAAVAAATFEAALATELTTFATKFPQAMILCISILPRNSFSATVAGQFQAASKAAVDSVSVGRVSFFDVAQLNLAGLPYGSDFTTNFLPDGTHLNTNGHKLLASALLPMLPKSYARFRRVLLAGKVSLSTVGYELYSPQQVQIFARQNAAVAEIPAASGQYCATINFPKGFAGELRWTDAVSPTLTVSDFINPGESEFSDAPVSTRFAKPKNVLASRAEYDLPVKTITSINHNLNTRQVEAVVYIGGQALGRNEYTVIPVDNNNVNLHFYGYIGQMAQIILNF